ncbi:MAG: hypothetical protein J5685_04520 [Clostridiales bacterium]|nr:hypothetical protein [Clostridiales bacterium]
MENNSLNNEWQRPINILYYSIFAGIFNYHFMASTMLYGEYFKDYFPVFSDIYDKCYWILLGLSIFTVIVLFKGVKPKIFPIAILAVALLYDHFRDITTMRSLSIFLMLIICSKEKSYKVIGVISLISGWGWVISSAVACKMGLIPDIVFGNRHSLGSIYMTDLACHFLTLMMVTCIIRKGKLKIWEYAGAFALLAVNILLMKAKVGFLCLFILMAGTLYYQYVLPHNQIGIGIKRNYKKMCFFAILILVPLMIYLTATYTTDPNVLYNKVGALDTIKSRLMLGRKAMDQYPITFWGTYIPERGNGGNTTGVVTDYFFLDISYVRVLFKEGIVIFALVIILFVKLQKVLADCKCIYLMFVVFVFLLDCSIEHHILEIGYDILPYLLFCNVFTKEDTVALTKQVQTSGNILTCYKC